MKKAFWLGLLGGIFGVLLGTFVIVIGRMAESFQLAEGPILNVLGGAAIFFAILGIIGAVMDTKKVMSAVTMIISGVAVMVSISLYGILPCVLLVIGGILRLKE